MDNVAYHRKVKGLIKGPPNAYHGKLYLRFINAIPYKVEGRNPHMTLLIIMIICLIITILRFSSSVSEGWTL